METFGLDIFSRRMWLVDCAEQVLYIYERECPDDARLKNVLDAMRQHDVGIAGSDEVGAAGRAAMRAYMDCTAVAGRIIARAVADLAGDGDVLGWGGIALSFVIAAGAFAGVEVALGVERWQERRLVWYLEKRACHD